MEGGRAVQQVLNYAQPQGMLGLVDEGVKGHRYLVARPVRG